MRGPWLKCFSYHLSITISIIIIIIIIVIITIIIISYYYYFYYCYYLILLILLVTNDKVFDMLLHIILMHTVAMDSLGCSRLEACETLR